MQLETRMFIRPFFKLIINTSNWNTTHNPTTVTSSAASKCSNSQPLMHPQPTQMLFKTPKCTHPKQISYEPSQIHQKGEKNRKKKLRQRKSKTKNRERKKHISGCWIWSCLLISLIRSATWPSISELNSWIALITHYIQQLKN